MLASSPCQGVLNCAISPASRRQAGRRILKVDIRRPLIRIRVTVASYPAHVHVPACIRRRGLFPCKSGTALHKCKDDTTTHNHGTQRSHRRHPGGGAARAAAGRQDDARARVRRSPAFALPRSRVRRRSRQARRAGALPCRTRDKLVILDEIHRVPELFQNLRGLIDAGAAAGGGRTAGSCCSARPASTCSGSRGNRLPAASPISS